MSIFPYCPKCAHTIDMAIPAISVEDLSVRYPETPKPVLDHVSFNVTCGTRVALLGGNGAGKSTLLKALVGIIPAEGGSIKLFGHGLGDCHHQVSYLPQRSEIDWAFPISLYRLVLSGSYIHLGWLKKPKEEHHQRTHEALKVLGLENFSENLIGHLSVGQQQRALLARALVHNPELFLLDEPFNAVDKETQDIMKSMFDQLKSKGKTLFIATHDRYHLQEDYENSITLEGGKAE